MRNGPLVSVIIPCKNAMPMLRATLNSVLAQTHSNIEIIFVNDNSSDGSLETAKEFAANCHVPFIITEADTRGVTAARAHGISKANGDYIQYLDADDELAPDKIALQVAMLEARPEIDIASCEAIIRTHAARSKNASLNECNLIITGERDSIKWFLSKNGAPIHCYILRRRVTDKLAFEKAWFVGRVYDEDTEYFTIAALLGFKFAHVSEAIVYYNFWSDKQATSVSRTLMKKEIQAIQQRFDAIANRPGVRSRMTLEDRKLLKMSFEIWKTYPNGIKQEIVADDAVKLTSAVTDGSLVVTKREASIVEIVEEVDGGFVVDMAVYVWNRVKKTFPNEIEVQLLLDRFAKAHLFGAAHEVF